MQFIGFLMASLSFLIFRGFLSFNLFNYFQNREINETLLRSNSNNLFITEFDDSINNQEIINDKSFIKT